jgi:hypothetical protein
VHGWRRQLQRTAERLAQACHVACDVTGWLQLQEEEAKHLGLPSSVFLSFYDSTSLYQKEMWSIHTTITLAQFFASDPVFPFFDLSSFPFFSMSLFECTSALLVQMQ